MTGLIDEVYIFDRALSQAEVQSLYNNNNLSTNSGNVLPVSTRVSVAAGATLDLGGVSQTLASITGSGMVTNAGNPATLTVSNSSGATTFSGSIGDLSAGNALSFVRSGGGTTILSGVNTYRGTTTVNSGTLLVNGSLGSGAVTVTSGMFGGNGGIGGTVTVQTGGTLAPGGSIGVLTVNNNVTLQPGGTTVMEINKTPLTNDQLRVTGALSYGGALVVTNLAGTLAANDSFQLFSAGSASGSFASNSLPVLNAGLGWSFNPTNGVLSVVQTVATNPTNIYSTVGSGNVTLSWPSDHLGWRLQSQTNVLSIGLGTNWVDVPNSTNATQATLPIDGGNGSVFFRLVFP